MKKLIFIATILLQTINSFSQAPNWIWARQASAGGTLGNVQEGCGVATDTSGNVYATGWFQDSTMTFGSITLTNSDNTGMTPDIFIAKYSSAGAVLWVKTSGGTGGIAGYSLATDVSGDLYVTGIFGGTIIFGSDTLINPGTRDYIFVVKYSPSGTVLWARSAGGTSETMVSSITTDLNGNSIITGHFGVAGSFAVFDSDTLWNAGYINLFIAKYDSNGNLIFAKSVGGSEADYGYSVATNISGDIYVTGYFSSPSVSFDSYTLNNSNISGGTYDVFIVKYSPIGTVLWAESEGGSGGDEEGYSVAVDAIGNVFLTGYFQSPVITFGTYTFVNSGGYDMFIVKYDSNGTVLLAKSAGGNGNDVGRSIAIDDSGIYLSGAFFSSSIIFGSDTLLYATGATDPLFIVKYDENLNVICTSALNSGGDDWSPIATDGIGNTYLAGDFIVNPFIVGTDTLSITSSSQELFFIAKYNCNGVNGINELTTDETISIYPNPFTFQTNINFAELQTNTTINITDILGQVIKTINFAGRQLVIDKAEMKAGIYFVQTTDEQKHIFNKKIIIQ